MRILLLEDDFVLGESIEEMLREAHYEVDWARSGDDAAQLSFDHTYDLYLFDVNVPEISGFELLEQLRNADDETPTIFISALSDISSITKGFSLGADDYLKKPFFPEELLVRVGAKLAKRSQSLHYATITYDPKTNDVTKDGKLITLGDVQLPLLRLFITNIGRTLTKESLFDLMEHPSDTALRVAINKLKQTTHWDIINIRGIGYRIEAR
ncbi:MAG TPA: response regulator transcription factor [Sulfuricurvum sp.]|nr:MAG: DNA-binding response regulator [Campylobacterales bacterium 16-40-21]OZA02760.1 MAG: DNA-binding response regulator [Sulfuricurvum sp. 17-40-25]HQS66697.1 response regulator transcription factor [Sulfuricurvum sp.]HQT37366.1 response regulator transcription factor [Sulfuricurvum sp.]